MTTTILETSTPWFGGHTGYECLRQWVSQISDVTVVKPKRNVASRLKGKWGSLRWGFGNAPQHNVAALSSYRQRVERATGIGHILYGEEFLPYAKILSDEVLSRTLFTFHQPASQWTPENLERLKRVHHAMFLYDREESHFSRFLSSPPSIVLHGADTQFFVPGVCKSPPRLLYNGIHLRNVAMLERVLTKVLDEFPGIEVDFLVPAHHRAVPEFRQFIGNDRVSWHAGLNDEELRELYQSAYLLLLPLDDSGANTAVVEALSCGLPIVTTDVGGIRNYGGNDVFPVVENNDDDAMLNLVFRYLRDQEFRNQISSRSRLFAEANLSWQLVAQKHVELYGAMKK